MKYMGSQQIFPTKIWGFEYDKDDLSNYKKLLYEMRDNHKLGKNGEVAAFYTKNSWQSPELTQYKEFQPLFQHIGNSILEIVKKDWDERQHQVSQVKFKEAWGNINSDNSKIDEHLHIGSDYSGVIYLDASPNSGNINFRDPRIHYEMIFQTNDFSISPDTGRCVVFPAWLRHSVDMNTTGKDRVGIAFNFTIQA